VTPVVTQSEWLIHLGIEARAQALSRANPDRAEEVDAALRRLVSPDEMGALFKVIAIHSLEWPAPGEFA
jgi:NADH dehydrogenase [ubiquinone] 1 alpha subcomplex assembly factor 7